MKKTLIIIIVLALLAGVVYFQRQTIRSFMGKTSPTPIEKVTTAPSQGAPSHNIYLTKADSTKGSYVTDFAGMTLYTYDKDTKGVSNCYNGCARAWPPYASGAVAQKEFPAHITVITRSDGSKQFAWDGMPLYYYVSDTKVGDITGDGVGGVWHLIKQ